jgi:hypothetical protein
MTTWKKKYISSVLSNVKASTRSHGDTSHNMAKNLNDASISTGLRVLRKRSSPGLRLVAFFFFNGSTSPWGPRPPHFSRLHDHTF